MIDIRHHVYSLAAVFLALALGMLIGSSFTAHSPSGSAGRRTIQRYESDMSLLKGEIVKVARGSAEKETALKACREYCAAVMPMAISNKLNWHNVAIVQTGNYDELTGSVKKALEMAGAQIISTVDIGDTFPFGDDAKISQLLVNHGLGSTSDPKSDRDKLFRILANTICTGKYTYLVSTLEESKVAMFSGSCDQACKMVVLIGGAAAESKNLSRTVDAQLLAQFEKLGITVVGCETFDAASSYIPAWHKAGIATVDNADDAMGQTCLIYALNGETANFGIKKTSDRLIPKTMETE